MRKLYLLATSVLLAFASSTEAMAQTTIEGCPADIDFSAAGNYVLYCSSNTSIRNIDMSSNSDNPFGYYYHPKSGSTYTKMPNWNTSNKSNTLAWSKANEWMYIQDAGEIHPLNDTNPTIMFTAPTDGWYYFGITFHRISAAGGTTDNPMAMRYGYIQNGSTGYALSAVDYGKRDANISADVVTDFFVNLKAGDKITTEQDCNGKNSSAGTTFTRFVVAAYTSSATQISDEYVAQSGLTTYNPYSQQTYEPTEGKWAIRLVGTDKYLVRKNKASGKNHYYSDFTNLEGIQSDITKNKTSLTDYEWQYELVKNENGGYNLKNGDYYVTLDAYVDETANANNNRFVFYKQKDEDTNISICRANDGKYWANYIKWVSPYNKITTSDGPQYIFELCQAPAESPYAFYNFDLGEKGSDNLQALANRSGNTVNIALIRSLSSKYWNTFCVPFAISADKIADVFGVGTQITEFTSVDGTTMQLTEAQTIEAGKPYLVKPGKDVANPSFESVAIEAATPKSISIDGYSFTGVYGPTTINTDGTDLFVTTSGSLNKPAAGKNVINGMRAYITIPTGSAAKLAIMGETTAVDGLSADKVDAGDAVYTIGGVRVDDGAKGIVIKNGKKYMVK